MPTTQEVLMAEQMRRQNSPLAQLAQVGGNIFQGYQKRQQAEGAKKGQAAAANFLNLAVQNPDRQDEYLTQALQADPQFVKTFFDAKKVQADAMGGAKPMTDYQKSSLALREEQIELDKLKAQQAKESNDLKKQQLQITIDQKKAKLEQDQKAIAESASKDIATFDTTLNTVDQLINHEGLDAAVGSSSLFPTIAGSKAADFEAKLEQLKGQQFLTEVTKMKGMGALSENEGKKIAAAAAALDLSMSEEAFRKELEYIQETMAKARNKIAGKIDSNEDSSPALELSPSAMKYLGGQ